MLKTTNKNKKEYYLSNNNKTYQFIIEKTNNNISIKHNNNIKLINNSNLKDFNLPNINNINDVYNFLINKFQSNNVKIKEIHNNLNIKLEISPKIILILPINKNQIIINTKNRITSAKNNVKLNIDDNSKNNPEQLKPNNNLIKGSFCFIQSYRFNRTLETKFIPTMDAFNSIDTKLPYIVYIKNTTTDIIFYNCLSNEITSTIKEAHGLIEIINIRHYLYDKKDIILSVSWTSSIKLWKVRTLECFLEIKKTIEDRLISACLFQDKKQYFIAVANNIRNIEVFDMNGKKIKEFPKSMHYGQFFDNFFDKKSSKNYFLYCGTGFLESYDYTKGKLFNQYDKNTKNNYIYYHHFVIYDNGIKIRLIATFTKAFTKGIIRIFILIPLNYYLK